MVSFRTDRNRTVERQKAGYGARGQKWKLNIVFWRRRKKFFPFPSVTGSWFEVFCKITVLWYSFYCFEYLQYTEELWLLLANILRISLKSLNFTEMQVWSCWLLNAIFIDDDKWALELLKCLWNFKLWKFRRFLCGKFGWVFIGTAKGTL